MNVLLPFQCSPTDTFLCLPVSDPVKVGNEGNKTAISGKLATMSCWYGLPDRVRQVLWRKTAEQGDTTTLASFAKRGQPSIEEPYRGRMTLNPSLGDTLLSIRPVKTEDEGCYTCEFHTYPEGTRSATACLFVYGVYGWGLLGVIWKVVLLKLTYISGSISTEAIAVRKVLIDNGFCWNFLLSIFTDKDVAQNQ